MNIDIAELAQGPNEPLKDYYQRTKVLLTQAGTKDPIDGEPPLSKAESNILYTIMSRFIHGLHDASLKPEAVKALSSLKRSLHSTFLAVEQARVVALEWRKWRDNEQKMMENQFYRDLAERNMTKEQIEIRKIDYLY